MKKEAGLWIDHKEAVIVTISGETEEVANVQSNAEHVQYSGRAHEIRAEDRLDRRFLEQLDQFYDEVISHIRDAESVLIFGPGEAKGELVKRLQSQRAGKRVLGVDAADRMTDRQIAAKVRQHFAASS
jgi:stalled ribosome rescue protein Dom34